MTHITQDVLIDYLHGELPPGDDAAVLLHLESCAHCRHEYDAQATLSESIRAYGRMTETELPGAVRAAIWQAIAAGERPSWSARMRAWLRPAAGLGIAIAAAAAIAIGIVPGLHHSGPVIDAVYYLDDHAALTSAMPFGQGSVVPSSLVASGTPSDQQWLASSTGDVTVDGTTH